MKVDYNNLYTHFVFSTLHQEPIIPEKNRSRIEKYVTGIVKNNLSKPEENKVIRFSTGFKNHFY
jgi:hypothetical protein